MFEAKNTVETSVLQFSETESADKAQEGPSYSNIDTMQASKPDCVKTIVPGIKIPGLSNIFTGDMFLVKDTTLVSTVHHIM